MRILITLCICCLVLSQTACIDEKAPNRHKLTSHAATKKPSRDDRPLESTNPSSSARSTNGILPTKLEIPSIRLQAPVETVGVLSNGAMGVPQAFDRVGLLYPAILPGEKGNAVIDGHVDHYTGPAVFFHLKELKTGDQIKVSDQPGKPLTFVVKTVESFKTKEAPLHRIFGPADKPRLNLITCTGKFNRRTKEHTMRLVVFSELQS